MRKEKMTAVRIFDIVMGIIFQIVCLLPWLQSEERTYPTFWYLIRVLRAGGADKLMARELPEADPGAAMLLQLELVILVILQALALVQLIIALWRKNNTVFTGAVLVMNVAVTLIANQTPPGYLQMTRWAYLYPIVLLGFSGVSFMGSAMIEQWSEASREEKQRQEAHREYKKERKRRLKFEGKYSKLFYQIIWKNFLYSWKEYSLFLASTVLVTGLLFSGFGIRQILLADSTEENLLMGQGLGTILMNFILVACLLSVGLVTFILLFYLKSRMRSLSMFLILGIRRRTLFLYCGLELLSCFVSGILGGLVLGNILTFVFRQLALKMAKGTFQPGNVTGRVYGLVILCILAVFFISAIAVHDVYTGVGKYQSGASVKEKMPGRFKIPGIILGVILTLISIGLYNRRTSGESMVILGALFLALYFLVRNGGCVYLRLKKRKLDSYLKNMAARNTFYHKFGTCSRYIFVLAVIHISALFIFTVPAVSGMASEPVEELYPYDVVCLANESDREFFHQMEDELDVEAKSVPMVRATTVDNTEMPENIMDVMIPQGQNIGISQSSYRILKEWAGQVPAEFKLDEEGKQIYVVYQQDKAVKAHPIDWYPDSKAPYVRIGQPVNSYFWLERSKLFPPRTIVGEETGSVIGSFRQGKYENLIVFSDAYFEAITKEETEGATELVLLQVPETAKTDVEQRMKEFAQNHTEDEKVNACVKSYYFREKEMKQRNAERIMEEMVNLFLIVMLLVVSMFLLHTKVEAEIPSYQAKYQFLEILGMREKERIATAKKEITPFIAAPLIIAGTVCLILTGITLHLRQYEMSDVTGYLRYAAVIYAGYIFVQYLDLKFLQRHVLKSLGLKAKR